MINSKCGDWPIGVCSWSLKKDIGQWGKLLQKWGIGYVNLAVGPAMEANGEKYLKTVARCGWAISCTMIGFGHEDYSTLETIKATGGIGPEEHWRDDKATVLKAMDITAELGVKYLAMHAGFIDYTRPKYANSFLARFKELVKAAEDKGIVLLTETGQESATELRRFLEELDSPAVGVNFDPANMILYNKGNPIEAVRLLGPWIKHVHVKDAVYTTEPGTWGQEVSWGDGAVGAELFLRTLQEVHYDGVLSIEREQGDDPLGDISKAIARLVG
jgi:L-ribulose-5-phosphate 3-epimerase